MGCNERRPVDMKNIAVNSLVFHSSEPTWLFCGTNDRVVSLWDVSTPSLPTYDSTIPMQLLNRVSHFWGIERFIGRQVKATAKWLL